MFQTHLPQAKAAAAIGARTSLTTWVSQEGFYGVRLCCDSIGRCHVGVCERLAVLPLRIHAVLDALPVISLTTG